MFGYLLLLNCLQPCDCSKIGHLSLTGLARVSCRPELLHTDTDAALCTSWPLFTYNVQTSSPQFVYTLKGSGLQCQSDVATSHITRLIHIVLQQAGQVSTSTRCACWPFIEGSRMLNTCAALAICQQYMPSLVLHILSLPVALTAVYAIKRLMMLSRRRTASQSANG